VCRYAVAAVVTADSDFFVFGCARVANLDGTAHLFHDADDPKPIRVWLSSSVGVALLSKLRHRVTASSKSSTTFGGLVTTVPPGLLYDVAAWLGRVGL
jgi:hypothetical protein